MSADFNIVMRLNMNTKEEIILNILNEDVSSYVHLMEHDRQRLAHTIALRLEAD